MHLNKIRQVHTFGHPHQYLLQPPFVKITASRRFLLPLMSVWFLDEGILDHSSLQNISSSVRFDGCLAWTARVKSSHRFSIIFKSGLGWTFQELILVPLHKCLGRFGAIFLGRFLAGTPNSRVTSTL